MNFPAAVWRRTTFKILRQRSWREVLSADRSHLHHRILDARGANQSRAAVTIYLLATVLGCVGLVAGMIGDTLPDAQVFGFDTFTEAHRFANEQRVAVAFIDAELQEDSSFILAKLLQSISPRTNIIFLTKDFSNTDAAWEIHPSGCVVMPLTAEKIHQEIENLRYPVRSLK